MKKRSLGRGLSELGVSELLTAVAPGATSTVLQSNELKEVALDTLEPGKYQPRKQIDEEALKELADSIRAQGVIQPLIVRQSSKGYEIIAGERRWRAAKEAGLDRVPVVIKSLTDEAALAISLIENIQRQDLNVMEEAVALERLIEEFKLTHQEAANAVGKSRASVTNLLRLLNLTEEVRDLVQSGQLDMGHARALLALEPEEQLHVANRVVARSLTVRETEQLIRNLLTPTQEKDTSSNLPSEELERLKKSLAHRLKTKVNIKQNTQGRGRLVIYYKNLDQLDSILQHLE